MTKRPPILSLVTLGTNDLARSIAFYEALGFPRKSKDAEGVGFFVAGAVTLSVYPAKDLAKDAGVSGDMVSGYRGTSLAWNVRSEAEVADALAHAEKCGAKLLKPAYKAFWGGTIGYFADPDGHVWEVAFNPGFPLTDDDRLSLPD